jgi:hypothetical protein
MTAVRRTGMKQMFVVVAVATSFVWSSMGFAEAEKLEARHKKNRRIVKSGSVKKNKKRKIRVRGRGEQELGEVAKTALKRPRDRAKQLRKNKRARYGDVVETESFIETDHATIFISSVKATIESPTQLRKSDAFATYNKNKKKAVKVEDLEPVTLEALDAFRASLLDRPEDDPLRKAGDVSLQALLNALHTGVGDVEVRTTVIVPINPPEPIDGGLVVSSIADDGGFDAVETEVLPAPMLYPPAPLNVTLHEASSDERTGSRDNTHKFVLGNTITDSWEWEEDWNVPGATVVVSAGGEYGFGLRVPVEVTTTVSPTEIEKVDAADTERKYKVEVTATAKDANASYYESAGVPADQVANGDELVLYGSVYFRVEGVTDPWFGSIPFSLSESAGLYHSDDFTPPFGTCGSSCGFDLWVPASVTGTDIDVGVFRGEVEFGVRVSGTGTFKVDYTAQVDSNEPKSTLNGADERNKHALEFDRIETHTLRTTLRALKKQNNELTYGYKLDRPRFNWQMDAIPGIQGSVTVDVAVWDYTFNVGPWFLDAAAVDIGTITLGAHEGTVGTAIRKPGTKTWRKPTTRMSGDL